jgi:hypothetical protein
MFWLVYWCLDVAVWGHIASRVPPKDFPHICIINICFTWQMSKLSLKKSNTLRFSSYPYNEHMFQLTEGRALAKKERYCDTKNCHHDAMWKAATRHFASNEWDSKGILDSNERPWRHMAQNFIKTNLTEVPFNLLPGDRVIVLSRTNRGGLWWDWWRREHRRTISDSIQNLLIIKTGIKFNAQGWASAHVRFPYSVLWRNVGSYKNIRCIN